MIVPPGFSLPGLLGVLDHLHRHAVLDRVAGVGGLDLGVDVGGDDAFGNAVEADHRRVADGLEDVVIEAHITILCRGQLMVAVSRAGAKNGGAVPPVVRSPLAGQISLGGIEPLEPLSRSALASVRFVCQ